MGLDELKTILIENDDSSNVVDHTMPTLPYRLMKIKISH